MSLTVVDASVAVKWIFPDAPGEDEGEQALALLDEIRDRRLDVLQPPHWLAEVSAVVTRLSPAVAEETISFLIAMELSVADTPEVYLRASELAAALNHHLFDTLYHAVALCTPDTTLLTADMSYYRKAKDLGSIAKLSDFRRVGDE